MKRVDVRGSAALVRSWFGQGEDWGCAEGELIRAEVMRTPEYWEISRLRSKSFLPDRVGYSVIVSALFFYGHNAVGQNDGLLLGHGRLRLCVWQL